jgi:mxaJ protein
MSLRFLSLLLVFSFSIVEGKELRVCADPDNLPFSDEQERGFENRLARLAADALKADLVYAWLPQRRGFVRKSVGEGLCDVWMGVPAGFERLLTTRPYYRSSYVFIHPENFPLASFDDSRLKTLRVGVQLPGNDLAATPPGHALAARGIVDNVVGYTVFGEGPAAARIVRALERKELDAAVVWGPQAGYFASRASAPLAISVANAPAELAGLPFQFSIAIGVRRGAVDLRNELDAFLEKRKAHIDEVLAEYAVPRLP